MGQLCLSVKLSLVFYGNVMVWGGCFFESCYSFLGIGLITGVSVSNCTLCALSDGDVSGD